MKLENVLKTISCLAGIYVCIGSEHLNAQNIGINATGILPNAKAILDVDVSTSSNKMGLLLPRMTTAERNSITGPIPESLLIYNTTTQCFEAWNQAAGIWGIFGCIGCTTPGTLTAIAATSVGTNSFITNWNATTGATAYLLDVSTSSTFASFVGGYNGLNVGNVTSGTVNGLTCGITYYYRVRATSACGTGANSNTISSVVLGCSTPVIAACGTQVWAAFNLDVGTMINSGTASANNSIVEKYCYNDLPANCTTYGGLYQWDEMMSYAGSVNCDPCGSSGVQGICPAGFHIPTDLEWSRYEFCLESTVAPTGTVSLIDFQTLTAYRGTNTGSKLKASASNTPPWDGTNTSGFAALPAGYYAAGGAFFSNIAMNTNFWAATDQSTNGWYRRLGTGNIQSGRFAPSGPKSSGFSVRCLQD